jgi:hypothetical protein
MPVWGWVLVAIGAVAVLGLVLSTARRKRRTAHLQDRFGPEYDRTIETAKSRREAEGELAAREERREQLEIRPLSQAARERYLASWQTVQAQFVDDPDSAVVSAEGLIGSVMADCGYSVEDFDQRAADVSVDHPQVVENYRAGHRLAQSAGDGDGSTENLRRAMRHYRALFDELVEPAADDPTAAERPTADTGRRQSGGARVVR